MTTMQNDLGRDLLRLWRHEARSFLEYLASDAASPVVIDDADRKVLAVLNRFHEQEQKLQLRVLELLRGSGMNPDSPAWPLGAPTYNFMRPAALARVFAELAKKDLDALAAIRERHAQGGELQERLLRYVIDDAVKLRTDTLTELAELLGLDKPQSAEPAAAAETAATAEAAPAAPSGPAWHDEALSIEERMALAAGKGLFEKLFAAMAQTDCTACGYDCEGYARAIAEGQDKDISKCAPGGDETKSMLKKLMN